MLGFVSSDNILFYHVIFCYHFLNASLLSKVRQKGGRSRWKGMCGGTEKNRGREKCNQNMLHTKSSCNEIKREKVCSFCLII